MKGQGNSALGRDYYGRFLIGTIGKAVRKAFSLRRGSDGLERSWRISKLSLACAS